MGATPELYLGLLSGTSTDGVDAAIVEFGHDRCRVLHAHTTPFTEPLQRRLSALIESRAISLADLGALDTALGNFFADCALACIHEAGISAGNIRAIGHHGQTVFHEPDGPEPSTLQIGDPNRVAARTGITTVADFRRMDMALGGQGAPLMSAFHDWLLRGKQGAAQAVVNIGGIANVTIRAPNLPLLGFDTGPGNTLMDLWIMRCLQRAFDADGTWAAGGRIDAALLEDLLRDEYFKLPPPKSTGREYFHLPWLLSRLARHPDNVDPQDVQATLCELTAITIAAGISSVAQCERVMVCGGGAYNSHLLAQLQSRLPDSQITTTGVLGIEPEWIEAAGFAWLARMRLHGRTSSSPSVTGALRAACLGGVYCPDQ
jgi:anhydro-N-acetylmuramic acid kinase